MVVNQKVSGRASSMPVGVGVGVGVSTVITLALSGLLAWLILGQTLEQSATGYGSMGILLTASVLGALAAVERVKRRRMVVCLLTGLGYYLVLLSLTALFFGGQYSGMGVTGLLIAGGSFAAGLIGAGKGEGGKIKSRKRRSR